MARPRTPLIEDLAQSNPIAKITVGDGAQRSEASDTDGRFAQTTADNDQRKHDQTRADEGPAV